MFKTLEDMPLDVLAIEAVGKVTGDARTEASGKADKAEGKVQNAIGGAKDAARDALKR